MGKKGAGQCAWTESGDDDFERVPESDCTADINCVKSSWIEGCPGDNPDKPMGDKKVIKKTCKAVEKGTHQPPAASHTPSPTWFPTSSTSFSSTWPPSVTCAPSSTASNSPSDSPSDSPSGSPAISIPPTKHPSPEPSMNPTTTCAPTISCVNSEETFDVNHAYAETNGCFGWNSGIDSEFSCTALAQSGCCSKQYRCTKHWTLREKCPQICCGLCGAEAPWRCWMIDGHPTCDEPWKARSPTESPSDSPTNYPTVSSCPTISTRPPTV